MSKCLISGAAGFLGSHFVDYALTKTDWGIVCLVRMSRAGDLNRLALVKAKHSDFDKRCTIVYHDLNDNLSVVDKHIGEVDYIVHMAADSHVDYSIENPLLVYLNNTRSTANMLEYARHKENLKKFIYYSTDEVYGDADDLKLTFNEMDKLKPSNPYAAGKASGEMLAMAYRKTYKMPIVITRCHDEKTRCWTEDGIKTYEQLKLGDKVWTLQDNKDLKLEPIEEIFIKPYEGEMIEFKSQKYSLVVTPDHRMLTKKRFGEKVFTIKRAADLENISTRHYLPLTGEWKGKRGYDYIDISKYIRKKKHFNIKDIDTLINPLDLMELIGWFVSEGSVSNGTVSIGCTQYKDIIASLLNRLGVKYRRRERSIEFSSVLWADFFQQFGHLAENKQIPKWVLKYNKQTLLVLFNSLILGDGTFAKYYTRYYTKSYKLAQDVCEVCIKLGYSVGIKSRETFVPDKSRKEKSYYVSIRKNSGSLESKHIKRVNYNGVVWCVRTASGNFFVERDGNYVCSGNTMNMFGEMQDCEKMIPKVIQYTLRGAVMPIHAHTGEVGSRFWLYAKNSMDGLLYIIDKDLVGEYNFRGQIELNNLQVAERVASVMHKKLNCELVECTSVRPGHDRRYSISDKLIKACGWKEPFEFEDSFDKTVRWYLRNLSWVK